MTLHQLDIELVEDPFAYDETDDGGEHLTHIVSPPENRHISDDLSLEAQDIVDIARASGEAVKALCGYEFIPQRDPEKYPACQACFKVAETIMSGLGE